MSTPATGVNSPELRPAHVDNEALLLEPIQVKELPQLREKEFVDTGVPERVFCGSPKQHTWKVVDVHNATVGQGLANEKGWAGGEWTALLELWACESSWGHLKANYEGSGAYGIAQSLPASKMASHGEDYLTNPVTQVKWGIDYIVSRYGSPSKALAFHYANNWY